MLPIRPALGCLLLLSCAQSAVLEQDAVPIEPEPAVAMVDASDAASHSVPVRASHFSTRGLVTRLAHADHRDETVQALLALGRGAVPTIGAAAREPNLDVVAAGHAILVLRELGGAEADQQLALMHQHGRLKAIVRTWAGAARLENTRSFDGLVALASLPQVFPALAPTFTRRAEALMGQRGAVGQLQLLALLPQLRPTLAASIMQLPPAELVRATLTGPDNQVRQSAAGYVAAMAQRSGRTEIARSVVSEMRYRPGAEAVPWEGGALFLPSIGWNQAEARGLVVELVAWFVHCERRGLTQQRQQLTNNLASVGLTRAAGFRVNAWTSEALVAEVSRVMGPRTARSIVRDLGLTEDQALQGAIDSKGK